MTDIRQTFNSYFIILDTTPNIIKDYAEYIEHYTEMTNNNKRLEEQKTQIENMQGQLKRLEGTIKHEYSADLEWIKAQYSKFQVELVKAAETIANKKEEMVASIKREMEFVNRYVKQYEQNLMKDKFVD